MAWPDRKTVAYDEGLDIRDVENALYELRRWGHIDWEQRADARGRLLLHYTLPVRRWTDEEIIEGIIEFCSRRGSAPPKVCTSKGVLPTPNEYTAHGVHRPGYTPRTVARSTPRAVCSNLYKGTGEGAPLATSSLEAGTPTSAAPLETGLGTKSKGQGTSRASARDPDDVDQAFDAYNEAADHYGFFRCESRTEDRRRLLKKRLTAIGGIGAFRRALSAIPRDHFLMGRRPPRPGEDKPFRLSLDRLLKTKGGMGDVLAGLIDLAGDSGRATNGAASSGRAAADDLHAKLERIRQQEAGQCSE
jgi:hypothetical protein